MDLVEDLKRYKEEGKQRQLNEINYEAEVSAATFIEETIPCPKPGAAPKGQSNTIRLKVENTFGGTRVNGKDFNKDEYER